MSHETFELIQLLDKSDISTQLALQCAPLISGIKISNLLIIHPAGVCQLDKILQGSMLSYYMLAESEDKTVLLLFHKRSLEEYLLLPDNLTLLKEMGYQRFGMYDILPVFALRYQNYLAVRQDFPHEMGVLLGYPIEDVRGFIDHNGKNFIFSGYWKVYGNPALKMQLFRSYERAKHTLVQLISEGAHMSDIIHFYYHKQMLSEAAG